ncbi:MAG: hypothetical protein OXJ52_02055 [Oligoflexia bacterium]|nr:hypothetical protein [Oligoflexia bacterium]
MFHQALKRLFLILFPVILFLTALYLSHIRPPKQSSVSQQILKKNCPFYLGVSFFSKKTDFQKNKLTTYLLPESAFTKKTQDLKLYFQKENVSLEQILFVFPLTLTKEEEWTVSQKTLFILPTGERKQISHLTYSEINNLHKSLNPNYKALKLSLISSFLPKKSNFLFYLLGSNRQKIIKNLDKIQNKIQGNLYLSSSNEKLLKDLLLYRSCANLDEFSEDSRWRREDCLAEISNRSGLSQTNLNLSLKANFKILHSFKTFIRLEMLSVFPQSFKQIEGQGIVIPNSFPPAREMLDSLKQENKLLFFEKDPPYTKQDKYWIENSQALISSQTKLAISSIKDKKACLIKN